MTTASTNATFAAAFAALAPMRAQDQLLGLAFRDLEYVGGGSPQDARTEIGRLESTVPGTIRNALMVSLSVCLFGKKATERGSFVAGKSEKFEVKAKTLVRDASQALVALKRNTSMKPYASTAVAAAFPEMALLVYAGTGRLTPQLCSLEIDAAAKDFLREEISRTLGAPKGGPRKARDKSIETLQDQNSFKVVRLPADPFGVAFATLTPGVTYDETQGPVYGIIQALLNELSRVPPAGSPAAPPTAAATAPKGPSASSAPAI